jgi:hypothetical protein
MKSAPFVALSATFMDDPAVVAAGERAAWLYLAMACDCRLHRSDGTVPEHRLARLGVVGWQARLQTLLTHGLVIPTPDGYNLPAYLKWNKSEHAYQKRSATGKVNACQRHHVDCRRDDCAESLKWLQSHGYPIGLPTG